MTITPDDIATAFAATRFKRMTQPRPKHRVIDRDKNTCTALAAFVLHDKELSRVAEELRDQKDMSEAASILNAVVEVAGWEWYCGWCCGESGIELSGQAPLEFRRGYCDGFNTRGTR